MPRVEAALAAARAVEAALDGNLGELRDDGKPDWRREVLE